jgi:hypothetical protein
MGYQIAIAFSLFRKFPVSSSRSRFSAAKILSLLLCSLLLLCFLFSGSSFAREKELSPGFVGEIAGNEADVMQAIQEVLKDQIIHGTWVYDKDKTLMGATVEQSSPDYPPWKGPGTVYYKIYRDALAPRFFKDSNDLGTISVRYVVQTVAPGRVRIRIDAVFVERERRSVHPSEGIVESSEFKAIQDHFQAIELQAQVAAEARARTAEQVAEKEALLQRRRQEATALANAESSARDLVERIKDLRHRVEMRTVGAGAVLKSAPFQGAAPLQNLKGDTEVLILIITPYWYGVETTDGLRGWIRKVELEPLP